MLLTSWVTLGLVSTFKGRVEGYVKFVVVFSLMWTQAKYTKKVILILV